MSDSILSVFAADDWRMGDLQIIPYDRRRTDLFGDHYLYHLYQQCLLSRPNVPGGTLIDTFCGMVDVSCDAICSYLTNKPIALLCIHTSSTEFTPAGFCWPTQLIKSPKANSAFCAFSMFRSVWGTPDCTVLGMLGIAYLFEIHNLRTILGQRLTTNVMAGRWMAQYGTRDIDEIPDLLQTHDGDLAGCTASVLHRADFESYCKRELIKLAGEGIRREPERTEMEIRQVP